MMRLWHDFNPIVQFYTLQLLMMSFIIFVYENRMIQRKSHHKISGQYDNLTSFLGLNEAIFIAFLFSMYHLSSEFSISFVLKYCAVLCYPKFTSKLKLWQDNFVNKIRFFLKNSLILYCFYNVSVSALALIQSRE